jgi:hypothetical protein
LSRSFTGSFPGSCAMARSSIRSIIRLFSAFTALSVMLAQGPPVLAQTVPSNLDLSTTTASATAAHDASSPVVILTGGRPQSIAPGASVTPAQAVAVSQVMSSGMQSIELGALGNAIGGTFTFASSEQLSNFLVPAGVTAIANFTNGSALNIVGNLVNSGNLYAVSTSSSVTDASIAASLIKNASNGLISTVLPATGLPGFGDAIHNLGLSLSAEKILNQGTISSAASLNVAAPIILNAGSVSAVEAINLSSPNAVAGSTMHVLGGNYAAPTVNIDAGCGKLDVDVNRIDGLLSVTAGSANTGVHSGTLNLGNITILGDPTFYNNAPDGDIIIGGNVTVGEGLAVLASRNVDIGSNTLTAQDGGTGQGFDITIVAGAALTPSPGAVSQSNPNLGIFPGTGTPIDDGETVKVTGASASGGSITCLNCSLVANSFVGTGDFDGGNILLAAYENAAGNSGGDISLFGNSSITTNSAAGKAGNITLIAPDDIEFRTVNFSHTGGTLKEAGGTFTVTTAQPTGSMTLDSSGQRTGSLSPGPLNPDGQITVDGGVNGTSRGTVVWRAGASIFMTDTASINVGGGSTVGDNGGTVTLDSKGDITLAGTIAADGNFGINGIDGPTPGASGTNGTAGGNGGKITISATGNIVNSLLSPVDISADGADGGNGGNGVAGNSNLIPNGGKGGNGGAGGLAGTITITGNSIDLTAGIVRADGGSGGSGGDGGDGYTQPGSGAALQDNGGAGGAAGNGGAAQKGGVITLTSKTDIGAPQIDATGGDGGDAGDAGDGGNGGLDFGANENAKGGAAGAAGTPTNGGAGGIITLKGGSLVGNTISLLSDIDASGGSGGDAGAGGSGGGGHKTAIAGVSSKDAGDGGKGGAVTVSAASIGFASISIDADGGTGGSSASGGNGGQNFEFAGAKGANAGDAGSGGAGGSVKLTATLNDIAAIGSDDLAVSVSGGNGGFNSGLGGNGGRAGTTGGAGGNSADAGAGGAGGIITLSAKGSLETGENLGAQQLNANGGSASFGIAVAGTGGQGSNGATQSEGSGGNGGKGGNGAAGGNGGTVTLTGASVAARSDISASGGSGSNGGRGGAGGDLPFSGPAAGNGGAGSNAGAGGKGGTVKVTATSTSVQVGSIFATGASGGDGGNGGHGGLVDNAGPGNATGAGGNGGNAGNAGASGQGGSVTLTGKFGVAVNGTIDVTGFGFGGGEGGDGGLGRDGFSAKGGNGGNGGTGGAGAKGGTVAISAFSGFFMPNTAGGIFAGGGGGGDNGVGGDAGEGNSGVGGTGGDAGTGGNGGAGGSISIVDSSPSASNSTIAAQLFAPGGSGGAADRGGDGRDGTVGGDGGDAKKAGNGGAGGKISFTANSSVAVLTLQSSITTSGGAGGSIRRGGHGGDASAGNGGNGGVSAAAGTGGNAGTIALKSGGSITSGLPGNSWILANNGGNAGPNFGEGGSGGDGAGSGKGGRGGFGGIGASGGNGGAITIAAGTTIFNEASGSISASGGLGSDASFIGLLPTGGNGGNGTVGGSGGASGTSGKGGNGGKVTVSGTALTMPQVSAFGGTAGSGLLIGGDAGNSSAGMGAKGGVGGNTGAGGNAGSINLKATTGSITLAGALDVNGGYSGVLLFDLGTNTRSGGGAGGTGTAGGGAGGNAGSTGAGGKGGSITLSAPAGITANGPGVSINLEGGSSGATEAIGGAGEQGQGSTANGGNGGSGGATGAGGSGGVLSLTTTTGAITLNGISLIGGSSGDALVGSGGGNGGSGFAAPTTKSGVAGAAPNVGKAGNGGTATIKSTAGGNIDILDTFTVNGGIGGNANGTPGTPAAVGGTGGVGGAAGDGGYGGNGGKIVVSTTGAGTITLTPVNASGGAGGTAAINGVGGSNGFRSGGAGGAGGDGGYGGNAGSVSVSSVNGDISLNFSVTANGGSAGAASNGGERAPANALGTGGNGGAGGKGGYGGKGGVIKIGTTGTGDVSSGAAVFYNATAGSPTDGGNGGAGGSGAAGTKGGNGGNGGKGGNGANGGTIALTPGGTLNVFNMPLSGVNTVGTAGGGGGNFGAAGANGGSPGLPGAPGADGVDGNVITMEDDQDGPAWKKRKKQQIARADSHIKPVAFVQPTLTVGDRIYSAANTLVAPEAKAKVVTTCGARIHVAKGAVAFVASNGNDVSILALHDSKAADIGVLVHGREIHLRAGEQLVITNRAGSLSDTNPLSDLAVRNIREHHLPDGGRAFTCDFSIPSALSSLHSLKHLPKSPSAYLRATYVKLLKNAAALQMLNTGKGPYKATLRKSARA